MHLAGFKILSRAYEQMTFSGVSLCAAFIKAMTSTLDGLNI